jgi:hypothetical protein
MVLKSMNLHAPSRRVQSYRRTRENATVTATRKAKETRMGVGGRDLDAELEDMEQDVRNTTAATEDSDFDEMDEIEPLAGELDE